MKQTPFNTPEYATIKTNLKTNNKILRHNIVQLAKLGTLLNESQIE